MPLTGAERELVERMRQEGANDQEIAVALEQHRAAAAGQEQEAQEQAAAEERARREALGVPEEPPVPEEGEGMGEAEEGRRW